MINKRKVNKRIIATSKKRLEDEYQLKIFNLQMQLETLKMSFKNRENLLNEIEELRLERDAKLEILEKETVQLYEGTS